MPNLPLCDCASHALRTASGLSFLWALMPGVLGWRQAFRTTVKILYSTDYALIKLKEDDNFGKLTLTLQREGQRAHGAAHRSSATFLKNVKSSPNRVSVMAESLVHSWAKLQFSGRC